MTGKKIAKIEKVTLPKVSKHTKSMLTEITKALGVERDILPSDDQIKHAWNSLPRLLSRIPSELRDEGLIRMCVAVSSGLFDSGINYAWNAAILELREKVRRFGIHIIPQIIDNDFDEDKLLNLRDSELLNLCLKLNLISEDSFFMLDQCRDIRNNFSSAHPTIGKIDEYEFVSFVNRVGKFALNNDVNPQGVDIQELIKSIQNTSFEEDQYNVWVDRITKTFEAQRETVFEMLHGVYCDPDKGEEARINVSNLSKKLKDFITPKTASSLINRHHDYQANGKTERHKASSLFFEKLGLLKLLSKAEQHAIFSFAARKLLSVHNSRDNFYNEPPFAERLRSLSEDQGIPDTAQDEFVETVVTCSVGNGYGVCHLADIDYRHIIQDFSPREIQIMLDLPDKKNVVSERIKSFPKCKKKYKDLVIGLSKDSITRESQKKYKKWTK